MLIGKQVKYLTLCATKTWSDSYRIDDGTLLHCGAVASG